MQNIYQSSQFIDKNAFWNNFFQISAVRTGIRICAYMHAKFLVVEIVDRFMGQAFNIRAKFCCRQRTAGANFFVYS